MKLSIARRIKRSMIGLALTLCLFFTVMVMMMVYITEDQVFINLLRSEQLLYESLAENEQSNWQPTNQQMKLYPGIDQLPPALKKIVGSKPGVYEYFDDDRAVFVLRNQLAPDTTDYFISYDVSGLLAVRTSRNDLLLTVLVVSLVLIFLTVIVAYRLARQTLAPLKKLTEQLQDDQQDLPKGFAADFQSDEVGVLAKQLETSIAQAQTAAQREFEFNRGVSHELRSPIQIAQNALELLELYKKKADYDPGTVIDRLNRSIRQMKQITEAFLWLSSDVIRSDQVCDMMACMKAIKAEFLLSYPAHTITLTEADGGPVLINAPADVFMVVVGNLLKNAIQHGSEKVVYCYLNNDSVVIENPRDKASSENGSGSGYGVGTIIAQRMCERLGWLVQFDHNHVDTFQVKIHFNQR